LRVNRRRQRRPDALASPEAVRDILEQLRSSLPEVIPNNNKDFARLLHAVRHIQRYSATDTKRGRPSKWKRENLLRVATRLDEILARETSSRISVASFIDHYLRLLDFPDDVIKALAAGDINLFEASQLAKISHRNFDTHQKAKKIRTELLSSHLQTKESSGQLRKRINELLHTSLAGESEANPNPEDLEDFDPYDPTHLFWDQLKYLGFSLREIRREDVTDEEIDELLKASEPVLNLLAKIQRRKEKKPVTKLQV
jgi:hypothetical protein